MIPEEIIAHHINGAGSAKLYRFLVSELASTGADDSEKLNNLSTGELIFHNNKLGIKSSSSVIWLNDIEINNSITTLAQLLAYDTTTNTRSNVEVLSVANLKTIISAIEGGTGMSNPMIAEFDIIIGGVDGVPTRLASSSVSELPLASRGTQLAIHNTNITWVENHYYRSDEYEFDDNTDDTIVFDVYNSVFLRNCVFDKVTLNSLKVHKTFSSITPFVIDIDIADNAYTVASFINRTIWSEPCVDIQATINVLDLGLLSTANSSLRYLRCLSSTGTELFYIDGLGNAYSNGVLLGSGAAGMSNPMTTVGDIIYGGTDGVATRLAIGVANTVLMSVSGIPTWGSPTFSATSIIKLSATTDKVIDISTESSTRGVASYINITNTLATNYGIHIANENSNNGVHITNTSDGRGINIINSAGGIGEFISNGSNGIALYLYNITSGIALNVSNLGSGTGINMVNSSTGTGAYILNGSTGKGLYVVNSLTGYGIHIGNNAAGNGLLISNTSSGSGIQINNTGIGLKIDNSTSDAIYLNNTTSGRGIYLNNASTSIGQYILNSSTGFGEYLQNSSTGKALVINNAAAGTGIELTNALGGIAINIINNTNGIPIKVVNSSAADIFEVASTGSVNIPIGASYKINGVDISTLSVPSSTGSNKGSYLTYTTGVALSLGEVVYITSTSTLLKASGATLATTPVIGIITGTVATATSTNILTQGVIRNDSWSLTVGGTIYLSPTTAGAITQTIPSTTGQFVQVLGIAISTNSIFFNPSSTIIEL